MIPYPVNARVRVGEQWGSIETIARDENNKPLARPFYHVRFNTNETRIVLHEEIYECYVNGLPYVTVLVDAETFLLFDDDANHVTFSSSAETLPRKKLHTPGTPANVIAWRDAFWIVTGGCWINTSDTVWQTHPDALLTVLKIENVVPLAHYPHMTREPHYAHASHTGYLIVAPDLKPYVCTGFVFNLAMRPSADVSPRDETLVTPAPAQKQLALHF